MRTNFHEILADLRGASVGSAELNARIEVALFQPNQYTLDKRVSNSGRKVISSYVDLSQNKITHGTGWASNVTRDTDDAIRLFQRTLGGIHDNCHLVMVTGLPPQDLSSPKTERAEVHAYGRTPTTVGVTSLSRMAWSDAETMPMAICTAIFEVLTERLHG